MSIWCWTRARSTLVLKLWYAEAYRPFWDVSLTASSGLPAVDKDSAVHAGRHSYVHGIDSIQSTTPEIVAFLQRVLFCVV